MSVSVPKQLFDTLQAALQTEARRLCRDAAKILKRPEKEVLGILQSMPKLSLKIVDDMDSPTQCPTLLQNEGLLSRCRKPCILGTGRCVAHQDAKEPPELPESVEHMTRITLPSEYEEQTTLWVYEETQRVYDARGTIVGYITEDRELILYELPTDE
jgi:hypothetical protein